MDDDEGGSTSWPLEAERSEERFERRGRHLLSAVEHLIDDSYGLIAQVENMRVAAEAREACDDDARLELVAERIISAYSTRSAVTGAVSAAPALLPGGGTAVAVVGGSLADMTLTLKYEVEMALCLTHLHGFDIREDRGRWLAYALAAVHTYDVKRGDDYLDDLVDTQIEALMKYTPRQLSKMVVTLFSKLALLTISKSLVKALPLVGIVVGASANKMLTTSVGWRCVEALRRHREDDGGSDDSVVEAKVD